MSLVWLEIVFYEQSYAINKNSNNWDHCNTCFFLDFNLIIFWYPIEVWNVLYTAILIHWELDYLSHSWKAQFFFIVTVHFNASGICPFRGYLYKSVCKWRQRIMIVNEFSPHLATCHRIVKEPTVALCFMKCSAVRLKWWMEWSVLHSSIAHAVPIYLWLPQVEMLARPLNNTTL